jgi:hypothetical protein
MKFIRDLLLKNYLNISAIPMLMRKKKCSIWFEIEIAVYCLALWSIASLFLSAYKVLPVLWISGISWVVILAAFGFIGGSTKESGIKHSAKAGALAGVILGLAVAVLGIIAYYNYPTMFEEQVKMAVEQGVPADQVRSMMAIGIYAALIVSPLIYAGVGALVSLVTSWLLKDR